MGWAESLIFGGNSWRSACETMRTIRFVIKLNRSFMTGWAVEGDVGDVRGHYDAHYPIFLIRKDARNASQLVSEVGLYILISSRRAFRRRLGHASITTPVPHNTQQGDE